jgi:hypothetical protein
MSCTQYGDHAFTTLTDHGCSWHQLSAKYAATVKAVHKPHQPVAPFVNCAFGPKGTSTPQGGSSNEVRGRALVNPVHRLAVRLRGWGDGSQMGLYYGGVEPPSAGGGWVRVWGGEFGHTTCRFPARL